MIEQLRQVSQRFVRLWDGPSASGQVGGAAVVLDTVQGQVSLDIDVLSTRDSDLHIAVFSAVVGSVDEQRLRAVLASRSEMVR